MNRPNVSPSPQHTPLIPTRAWRYSWLIATGALIGASWAYVTTLRQPIEFVSHSRMFVSGRVHLPEAASAYSEELANYLGTQAEIMRSEQVAFRARQRVQLEQPGLKGDARMTIRVLPGTSIFTLSATGGRADYARAFLDALMTEFIQFKRERRMVTSQTTIEQISSELARLEQEIKTQEQALLRFKERNNVTYWEQQSVSTARFLADLKSREASLRMQLSMRESWERVSSERGLTGHAEIGESGTISIPESSSLSQARQKVDALVVERDELLRWLRPAHPKVKRLVEDISRQEKVIALGEGKLQERQKERQAALQAELDGLTKAIAEWEFKSLESSRIEAEYQKIRSTLDRTHDLYGRMLSSLQNLDTRKGVDQELVQILQPASPSMAVDRQLRTRTFSGLLSGAFAGVGLLLLAIRLDDRSYSVEDTVDRLGVRSFVEVPQRPSGPVSAGKKKFIESAFEESFRRLRSLVSLGLPAERTPVFLVTSALPAEGKSEVAMNLARAFARVGRRVLLVDADLRRGRIHHAMNAGDIGPGFHELLQGEATEDQVIRATAEPNLSLITAGSSVSHRSEILGTSDLAGRMESLGRRFDLIVVDTAPIGPVDDTNHLVPFATRVLFVVRMRHTPVRQAAKALSTLKARGDVDVGLVFNRVRQEGSRYYYYSYHQS